MVVMNKQLLIFLFVSSFIFQSTYAQFHISEKRVKKNLISKEIINYVEKNHKGSSAKYYKLLTDNDSIFFEAKVKSNGEKIDLIFNSNGQFVRMDNDIHYLEISEEIRMRINKHILEKVSTYKVMHCQRQRMVEQKTYELDVKAKKKRYKFRFNEDGTLIDYKVIPEKTIDFIFN